MKKLSLLDFDVKVIPLSIKLEAWITYYRIRAKAKKSDVDKWFLKMFREQTRRDELTVTVTHRKTRATKISKVKPGEFNRTQLAEGVIGQVQKVRATQKKHNRQVRPFGPVDVELTGGVHSVPNAILGIATSGALNNPLTAKSPLSKKLTYVGIELEFNDKEGYRTEHLVDAFKAADLGKYVNVGRDPSCGWEVRVLLPEDGFEPLLTKIMKIISDLGFPCDERCGTHIHLDMRHRQVKKVYQNFFYTQQFLRAFLTKNRKLNVRHCAENHAADFDTQAHYGRYHGINVRSYAEHKTLEIRMHQGTLEAKELVPWIKMLTRIASYTGEVNKNVLTLSEAAGYYNIDGVLHEQLSARLAKLGVF